MKEVIVENNGNLIDIYEAVGGASYNVADAYGKVVREGFFSSPSEFEVNVSSILSSIPEFADIAEDYESHIFDCRR